MGACAEGVFVELLLDMEARLPISLASSSEIGSSSSSSSSPDVEEYILLCDGLRKTMVDEDLGSARVCGVDSGGGMSENADIDVVVTL